MKITNRLIQVQTANECEDHVWVVFSTALAEGWLMLQCVECGLHGVVEAPSSEEWSEAFHSPTRPYRWSDALRVVPKPEGIRDPLKVIRTESGPRCECYERRNILQPGEFERFPFGFMDHSIQLSDDDRQELATLTEVVIDGRLCSFFFEFFLTSCEAETGIKTGQAALAIANRISELDQKGLHCSPAIVARLLAVIARR